MSSRKDDSKGWREAVAGLCSIFMLMVFAIGMSGCVVEERRDGSATIWTPVVGHVHDDNCGHYYHNDCWYGAQGHRHCAGCGHVYVNGTWIIRS